MELIFKRSQASNIVSKNLQSSDIVLTKNDIKFSVIALDFLKNSDSKRINIIPNPIGSGFLITCVDAVFEDGKDVSFGKKVGIKTCAFRNGSLHKLLGGEKSEYDIDKKPLGTDDEGAVYYALVEKVNGEKERGKEEEVLNEPEIETPEVTTDQQVTGVTDVEFEEDFDDNVMSVD